MPFQQSLGAVGLTSAVVSTAIWRIAFRDKLTICIAVIFPAAFILQSLVFLFYTILSKPHFSSVRHLPTPKQKNLRQRLLKEPNAFHFERWINDTPNQGLIRYFGTLNEERILLTTPQAVRQVLDTKAYLFEKQYSHKAHLKRLSGDSLVNVEGSVHKFQRKAMTSAFWVRNVDEKFFPIFWSKARHLAQVLENEVSKTSDTDKRYSSSQSYKQSSNVIVDDFISRSVFDIMGLAAFSTDFQCLSQPELIHYPTSDWRHAFTPCPATRDRMILALMFPAYLVDRLPIKFNRCMGRSINTIRHQGNTVIKQKQKAREIATSLPTLSPSVARGSVAKGQNPSLQAEKNDILDHIISNDDFTHQDALNQYMMLHSGGTHTAIAAVKSSIWFLAQPQNHHIQTRLRAEIRERIPSGSLLAAAINTSSQHQTLHHSVFERMPYLTAVRQEVLRLHSAFSTTGRTPIEPVEICGEILPPGISVSISPWAMHRSRSVWGDDADIFDPERWLTTNDNNNATSRIPQELGSFIAFGLGPRNCIARKFAEAELNCIIAAIFGLFEISFPEGVELPKITHQVTVAFKEELVVKMKVVDGWAC